MVFFTLFFFGFIPFNSVVPSHLQCKNLRPNFWTRFQRSFAAGIYLFKANNRNPRTMCEICSKLTMKTSRQRHKDTRTTMTSLWCLYDVALVSLFVNFEQISHIFFGVFIFDFEQVNRDWFPNICKVVREKGPTSCHQWNTFPAGNYMFQVNNRNIRTSCQICSELTINTSRRRSGVFTVNFEHISGFLGGWKSLSQVIVTVS